MSGLLLPHHSMTQDGPDYFGLFQRCVTNLDPTITVSYLRFFKGNEKYQDFLKHYVPLLPDELKAEFVADLDTPIEVAVEAPIETPAETVTETVSTEVPSDTSETITEPPKKKRGRKPKSSPTE